MAKLTLKNRPSLVEIMVDNNDLAEPVTDTLPPPAPSEAQNISYGPEIGAPVPASAGSVQPPISDEVRAMLVITGCRAHWAWNYWLVVKESTYGRGGVRANGSFEEWKAQISRICPGELG